MEKIPFLPLYSITKDGTIYSHKGGKLKRLKSRTRKGYESILLYKDSKQRIYSVHRLVAQTYIPNPLNKKEVNHKNGIKEDNRVENLEWATPSENVRHAVRMGLIKPPRNNGSTSKLTEKDVKVIRDIVGLFTQKELCEAYGVSRTTMSRVVNGLRWTHV